DVEGTGPAEILERRDVRWRERAVLDDERRRLPAADERELLVRSRDAAFFQRQNRGGEKLEDIPGRQIHPAGDREHAAGVEMAHVLVERLDGIQIAFRERMKPGRRGAEGIEQRDLYQVVTIAVPGDEADRIADENPPPRGAVRP